ncbi:uncharacterized protein LOC114520097 [Dendronephthya gigantea]|uniref:uncharacterized protein LOC114520097 n=1 Tax=Dendronephthya gigantea TaxID=151771 RepID=UPI00106BB380|nr:uncharacterized protein LOC114520097 [Dendronephthya gigantea]
MTGIQEPWRKSRWSTIVVCNKYCPGRKRARPSLQCIECKSFFHPECIFFNARDAKKIKNTFACTKCHLASDPNALKIRIKTVDLCPILKLSFDCLLGIFSFLSLTDLLSVACVCSTWKYVAAQPVLWKRVSFNGIFVKNWTLAEKYLLMFSIQRLDFRGIFIGKKKCETWHKITDLIHNTEHLKYLDFGRVPAGVLHDVVGSLSSLEVLTAEWIIDVVRDSDESDREKTAKIDIGKFSHLKNLKELRLRAACGCAGLQLPMFAFSLGMSNLSDLTKLRKLALTTFRDLAAQDFDFLTSLPQLEDLELGDCSEWEVESYESLGKLAKLQHLRLERAGSISSEGLIWALSSLKNLVHLELIMCEVPEAFSGALIEMPKLRTLSVWPDTFSEHACQVNTNYLSSIATLGLKHLQLLDWGVLTTEYHHTKDIVKYYPSYCKAQEKDNRPIIEFTKSLKESLFDSIPDLQFVQNGQTGNVTMSAVQLKRILIKNLPSTYVRVLPIPINMMDRLYFVI